MSQNTYRVLIDSVQYLNRSKFDKIPSSKSGPSAIVQALSLIKHKSFAGKDLYDAVEDLLELCEGKLVSSLKQRSNLESWFLGLYNRQSPLLLCTAANMYLNGGSLVKFSKQISESSIFNNLLRERPTVVKLNSVGDGTWVCLSGIDYVGPEYTPTMSFTRDRVVGIHVIDSVGNPLTEYKKKDGSDVILTLEQWDTMVQGDNSNSKWGFIFE